MSTIKAITDNLTKEELLGLNLHFNNKNKDAIKVVSMEDLVKLFFSEEKSVNDFSRDVQQLYKKLEEKGLKCTYQTRTALVQELGQPQILSIKMEYALGNITQVLEYMKDYAVSDEDADEVMQMAHGYVSVKKYDNAEIMYKKIIESDAVQWGFLASNWLANMYYVNGRYSEAELLYQKATQSNNISTRIQAHRSLANLYEELKGGAIKFTPSFEQSNVIHGEHGAHGPQGSNGAQGPTGKVQED